MVGDSYHGGYLRGYDIFRNKEGVKEGSLQLFLATKTALHMDLNNLKEEIL